MNGRFDGKIVLVTGAASGIGLSTAKLFAAEGASVMLADRNLAGAQSAADEIGANAAAISADVADYASCEAMVAATVDRFGGLDIAFNNAGVPTRIGGEFEDITLDEWRQVIDVNLTGVFHSIKAEVPALRARGGGAIVVTASVASIISGPGMPGYVAAKHGVAGLTKSAALDLIKHNIRVNAVCPGFIATGMTANTLANDEVKAGIEQTLPIQRVGDPDEIARAVLFLASDDASYMVGSLVAVDGGRITT